MRVVHLTPSDATKILELSNRATQRAFFKLFVRLNKHFSQSPTTMGSTFPLALSMNSDLLEQQLAQLFSQRRVGFTKKSFTTSALKPDRNRLVFPAYDIQTSLNATLLDDDHGRRGCLGFRELENTHIRCLQDPVDSVLLHQCGELRVCLPCTLRPNSLSSFTYSVQNVRVFLILYPRVQTDTAFSYRVKMNIILRAEELNELTQIIRQASHRELAWVGSVEFEHQLFHDREYSSAHLILLCLHL